MQSKMFGTAKSGVQLQPRHLGIVYFGQSHVEFSRLDLSLFLGFKSYKFFCVGIYL